MKIVKKGFEFEVGISTQYNEATLKVECGDQKVTAWYNKIDKAIRFKQTMNIPQLSAKPIDGLKLDTTEAKLEIANLLKEIAMARSYKREEAKHIRAFRFPCLKALSYYIESHRPHRVEYDDRDENPLPGLIAQGMKNMKCYDKHEIAGIITKAYEERIEENERKDADLKNKETQARETGKRVLLSRHAVEGSVEESDVDIISVYINPDGTRIRTQSPCY